MVATNLLDTLLRFADGSRAVEEDPITEVLAWLLDRERALLGAFLELLGRAALRRSVALRTDILPRVSTQVVVARVRGGSARYDLVLDSPSLPLRLVVEAKVNAALTLSGAGRDDSLGESAPRHQVDDYLELAACDAPGSHLVFTLAPRTLDVGPAAERHPCYGGHLVWQEIYDVFRRRLRTDRLDRIDATAKTFAEQFLNVMEARAMATSRMSYDGALAVKPFMKFRGSFEATMKEAWTTMHADGTLDGFTKYNASAWQDEHQRLGYRLWARSEDRVHIGFIGMYFGDKTTIEDIPDLYFFLEAPPKSRVHVTLEQRSAEIAPIVTALGQRDARTTWGFAPGHYQIIWATSSLAHVLADADPRGATLAFFRDVITTARSSGLLGHYLAATRDAPPSQGPEPSS